MLFSVKLKPFLGFLLFEQHLWAASVSSISSVSTSCFSSLRYEDAWTLQASLVDNSGLLSNVLLSETAPAN